MVVASVGHQCPECVAEGRRTQRPALTHFGGSLAGENGIVTKTLIGLNAAIFILAAAITQGASLLSGGSELHVIGAVNGPGYVVQQGIPYLLGYPGIDQGGFYRLLTAMFLHYGIIHLALNMYALWALGRTLEAALGPIRFAALYLIAGIGGNVAAYIFAPNSLTAGASTAIYGLFAAYFIVLKKLGRNASAVIPVIVINVALTFAIPGISIAGHLGGLVTGAICGLGLAYAPREKRTLVQGLALGGTLAALLVLTLLVSLSR
jgi:membrane associated rhomboid family serine protease